MSTYTPVIGLEVHVELKTKSKMFCRCSNAWFGEKPNSHTCPVCLGLPGALPVPNRKAIEWCVMIGMALNCKISLSSKFDRKNYFYPDLAKGYQISQFDKPFCENGHMILSTGKKIGIARAHMEEDTGKLIHETINGRRVSLIDFNRSGVPLVEIVTGPDFTNATEVKEYLQKLQQIVRYLDVANADMEKGEMRLEPNISLRKVGQTELPNYKVEVKNINSFSFVEKAINFELERQAKLLDAGETPKQETRGWDETKKATVSQRSKEEAADYRYFPEPDIPPIHWTQDEVDKLRSMLPELPDTKQKRFEKEFSLSSYNAEILTREREMADYFEEAVKVGSEHKVDATKIANTIINKKVDIEKVLPAALIKDIVEANKVASMDEKELVTLIQSVLSDNAQAVIEYKSGKETILMYLFGQIMKRLPVKIDPQILKDALLAQLKES